MTNFQPRKSKWRKVLESKLSLALLTILVFVFAWSVVGFSEKMRDTEEKRKIAEERLLELQAKKENLSKDIKKLETSEGMEENIREKFGLVKEGEGVIVIVEESDSEKDMEIEKESAFWNFLRNWFK